MGFSLLRMGSKESLDVHKLQPSAHNAKVLTDSIVIKDVEKKVSEVYNILNQKEHRNRSPHNSETLRDRVKDAIQTGKDLQLVVIWGGPKKNESGKADEEDRIALDRLQCLGKQVDEALKDTATSVKFTILFCGDMHQLFASGVDLATSNKYYKTLKPLAIERGMSTAKLEDYYREWYKHMKMVTLDEYIDDKDGRIYSHDSPRFVRYISYLLANPPTAAGIYCNVHGRKLLTADRGEVMDYLKQYDKEAVKRVFAATLKHSKLVKKGVNPLVTTAMYMEVESDFMSHMKNIYDNAVFISFSNPNVQRPLIGKIPTLFLCATAQGDGHCPWYPKKAVDAVDNANAKEDMDALMQKCYNEFDSGIWALDVLSKGLTLNRTIGWAKRFIFGFVLVPYLIFAPISTIIPQSDKDKAAMLRHYPDLLHTVSAVCTRWNTPEHLEMIYQNYMVTHQGLTEAQKSEVRIILEVDDAKRDVIWALNELEKMDSWQRYMQKQDRGSICCPMAEAIKQYEKKHGRIESPG